MDGIRLERLDIATCSKLRSTQIITSLPQIVSELVQNSLDAGASAIEIGVNKDEWSCWVRDNGTGISKDGLSQLATSEGGGRYCECTLHYLKLRSHGTLQHPRKHTTRAPWIMLILSVSEEKVRPELTEQVLLLPWLTCPAS